MQAVTEAATKAALAVVQANNAPSTTAAGNTPSSSVTTSNPGTTYTSTAVSSLQLVPPVQSTNSIAYNVSTFPPASQSLPTLDQPFIVGPGFTPIPYKLVQRIINGKFIDLSELLADNLVEAERDPLIFFDGKLTVTAPKKHSHRQIEDIVAWIEAFSIYSLIICSYTPHRWRDLTDYKLLIIRTQRQFHNRVWLQYDEAFRQHAAASKLTNWSVMNSKLFSLYATGAPV